jgi:hypothetical protein
MENGYVESFIGKLREMLPNNGLFDTLLEVRGLKIAGDGILQVRILQFFRGNAADSEGFCVKNST